MARFKVTFVSFSIAVCIVRILYNEHVLFIEPNSPQKAVFIERRKGEESILAQDLVAEKARRPLHGWWWRTWAWCLSRTPHGCPTLSEAKPTGPCAYLPAPGRALSSARALSCHNVHQCRLENVFF